jgi:hypothetical protein
VSSKLRIVEMGKTIQEILSKLENSRQEKKDELKQKEEEYFEKKEFLKKNYVRLLWDKDLNRPLNPYKGSNQGRIKAKKSGLVGQFVSIANITPSGDIDGTNKFFTLPQFPVPDSEHIILNGLLQDEGLDYIMSGPMIEFLDPPNSGDSIQVSYLISL